MDLKIIEYFAKDMNSINIKIIFDKMKIMRLNRIKMNTEYSQEIL